MTMYRVELTIAATAYVRADNEREAQNIAQREFENSCFELPTGEGTIEVSGEGYSFAPDVSLSPAITVLTVGEAEDAED